MSGKTPRKRSRHYRQKQQLADEQRQAAAKRTTRLKVIGLVLVIVVPLAIAFLLPQRESRAMLIATGAGWAIFAVFKGAGYFKIGFGSGGGGMGGGGGCSSGCGGGCGGCGGGGGD